MNLATINPTTRPIVDSVPQETLTGQFLFVKERDTVLPEALQSQHLVHNLNELRSYIISLPIAYLPELIILDIPLNKSELRLFRTWLSQNLIPPIPMIYKEGRLSREEISYVFTSNLVDDVIRDDYNESLLQEKIRFFKSLAAQSIIDPTYSRKSTHPGQPKFRKIIKRAIDITLSLLLLIVLSPVLLLIALLIKLTSHGPVLYKSKRAGEGFKIFDFYKFRTMVACAEEMMDSLQHQNLYDSTDGQPVFFKVSNDPRVTRIGQFLRDTSLDELPQLFNVLKGDMSLVGNRPLPLYEAATLTTPEWADRFMAPAGITGLWQVSRRGRRKMSTAERIALDIAYARSRSTRKDLKILMATPTALIQKQSQ